MRAAWFNCFSGIAGDMALGALLDAGADLDEVLEILGKLPIGGWSLRVERVLRGGISASRAVVEVSDDGESRVYSDIERMIRAADLPPRVRDRSLAVFQTLVQAEARIHSMAAEEVHLHEVGAHDALVDVVGTAAALEVLGVDVVAASAVTLGTGGFVRSAHGMLPNPAPAVVELLKGVPSLGVPVPLEMTTPTGAAIVRALGSSYGPQPSMVSEAVGFGAGSRDLDGQPNVTQVVIGAVREQSYELAGGQPVALVEANLDDVTAEVLARSVSSLLETGAHDAWVTPVVMKKGRPAHVLSALADPALVESVVGVIRHETGTLGVRATLLQRWPAARREGSVEIEGGTVRVKVGHGRVKVEHDDALSVAASSGLPLREVLYRAESAWRSAHGDPGI